MQRKNFSKIKNKYIVCLKSEATELKFDLKNETSRAEQKVGKPRQVKTNSIFFSGNLGSIKIQLNGDKSKFFIENIRRKLKALDCLLERIHSVVMACPSFIKEIKPSYKHLWRD